MFNARMSDFPAQEVLIPGALASVSRSISFTPSIGTLTRDATLDDVTSLVLLDDGAFQDSCLTNNPTNSAACFEPTVVPEPSTWLMMATGMLGLGFVTWRRREGEAPG